MARRLRPGLGDEGPGGRCKALRRGRYLPRDPLRRADAGPRGDPGLLVGRAALPGRRSLLLRGPRNLGGRGRSPLEREFLEAASQNPCRTRRYLDGEARRRRQMHAVPRVVAPSGGIEREDAWTSA